MGLKMSDAIDTDMIEESMIVIDLACDELKRTVFTRATREIDRQARHQADEVIGCFDAVKYSGHRRNKDLLLIELDQLGEQLDIAIDWSNINRPFDTEPYTEALRTVKVAQGAIYSALGIHRVCKELIPGIRLKI
jgi:hypothetical protein